MGLEAGQRFGAYEILGPLGEGGMGEVYRARDTELERDVAIKVLPESFASDGSRVARFEQEAKTLAALNHTNIAQVYGLAREDGQTAIVMELVEGPTLADRIEQGPLPADEALGIAMQIADALEAAHEQHIIHRDLKPANVKLRPDGTVKVLDFGIAKALAPELSNTQASPIMTTPVTQVGVILGTAAYMSPEQARGKPIDKRTDIWAFGCVLYEMLTGQLAFGGEDASVILARIIANETDLNSLPAAISPAVQRTLELCLQKDPKKRVRDIGDVRLALAGQFETGVSDAADAAATAVVSRGALPKVAATAAVVAAIAAVAGWLAWPAPAARPVSEFTDIIPDEVMFRAPLFSVLAVSPDGRRYVYNTVDGYYVRDLDDAAPRLISGTGVDSGHPFFSADSRNIAFTVQGGELRTVAVTGGASGRIGTFDPSFPFGANWEDNGLIYSGQPDGIHSVPATGGVPELIIEADGPADLYGPSLLPDGDHLLFTVTPGNFDAGEVVAQSLSTGQRTTLFTGGSDARFVATGHIVYMIGDTLFGVAFDPDTLSVSGAHVPLVEQVSRANQTPAANFGISDDGTLIYLIGTSQTGGNSLVWVDRDGNEETVPIAASQYNYPRISHAGDRVALDDRNENSDIWVWNFATGTRERLTVDGGANVYPVWTLDDARIAFAQDTAATVQWRASNAAGPIETLFDTGAAGIPQASPYFFADSGLVFRRESNADTGDDIAILPIDGDEAGEVEFLLNDVFDERNAELSPDRRWMAYQSDESGQWEIYVRPFPNVRDDRVTISNNGGRFPLWSKDGSELFYIEGLGGAARLIVVSVEANEDSFDFSGRAPLFNWAYFQANEGRPYDVSNDGQRFLVISQRGSDVEAKQVRIIQNWTEELKRQVPTG